VRLGLLADVHANLPALDAALAALGDADRIVCAGDLVGYGPHPNEVVALLAERGISCIAGNHDLVALGEADLERCDELAATTLRWTRDALSPDTRAFLAALPGELDLGDLLVVHGAPGDPWHYVRERDDAIAQLARRPRPRVIVAGHTHRRLEVATGARRWINPGSVGQSRERRLVARVALLDTDTGATDFRALTYDADATRAALERAGLPAEAIHRRPPLRAVVLRRRR